VRARPMTAPARRALAALAAAACAALLPAGAALAQPSVSNRAFQEADLDGDGFVDLGEFQKNVVRGFHAIDGNRDGFLDLDELRAIRVNTRSGDRLAQVMLRAHDADGDGRLSFREVVVGRMAYFEEADADRDDRLSASEAHAYDERMRERAREERAARRAQRAEQGQRDERP
jgi:hypothetical protein